MNQPLMNHKFINNNPNRIQASITKHWNQPLVNHEPSTTGPPTGRGLQAAAGILGPLLFGAKLRNRRRIHGEVCHRAMGYERLATPRGYGLLLMGFSQSEVIGCYFWVSKQGTPWHHPPKRLF